MDSWVHYVGSSEGLIKQVQLFYGVDITPYYNEPIPVVLAHIQQELLTIKKELETLPEKSKDNLQSSNIQHLMRAHRLPLWPEYTSISIETVFLTITVVIAIIIGWGIQAICPAITVLHAFLITTAFIIILNFIANAFINIPNRTKRQNWQSRVGKIISKQNLKKLTTKNKHHWILLSLRKMPSSYSFGTYQNFGCGWDSIILLNTYTSKHYAVKGTVKKTERYAKKIGLTII